MPPIANRNASRGAALPSPPSSTNSSVPVARRIRSHSANSSAIDTPWPNISSTAAGTAMSLPAAPPSAASTATASRM